MADIHWDTFYHVLVTGIICATVVAAILLLTTMITAMGASDKYWDYKLEEDKRRHERKKEAQKTL